MVYTLLNGRYFNETVQHSIISQIIEFKNVGSLMIE